jgi:pilus assembly protein CpaF
LDLSLPSLDAIFLDGTRLMYRSQAAGFSHFADGTEYRLERNQPLLAIRRFGREWTLEELVASGMLTQPMAEYLVLLPKTRSSVILGGPTGAGKSTLQNVLLGYLPQDELTGILEDTPDARPQGGFFVRYWTQHPNGEDVGEITIAQNLLDAKRSNFRNIVVAEMRDGPTALRAVDVAMMTSGFFSTTTHAVTPKKVIEAFVNLLQSAPERPSERRCYELFATVFHHIVCLEWLPERPPQVTAIAEVLETTETSVSYRTVFERVGDEVRYHGLSERMHRLLQKHHLSVPDALEGGIA